GLGSVPDTWISVSRESSNTSIASGRLPHSWSARVSSSRGRCPRGRARPPRQRQPPRDRAQVGDDLEVPARGEPALGALLGRGDPQLAEPGPLCLGERAPQGGGGG